MTTRPGLKHAVLFAATAALLATVASIGVAGDLPKRCDRSVSAGRDFDEDGQKVRVRASTGESGRRLDEDYDLSRQPAPRVKPSHAIDQDDPAMVEVGARADRPRDAERECE